MAAPFGQDELPAAVKAAEAAKKDETGDDHTGFVQVSKINTGFDETDAEPKTDEADPATLSDPAKNPQRAPASPAEENPTPAPSATKAAPEVDEAGDDEEENAGDAADTAGADEDASAAAPKTEFSKEQLPEHNVGRSWQRSSL